MNLGRNYNLYRVFFALYETRNMSRAAEVLLLNSHSNIGKSIKLLASELGIPKLFHSNPRGVVPTQHAIELYNIVRPLFDQISLAEESVQTFDITRPYKIRLAVTQIMISHVLKDFFKKFCTKYPNIMFEFHNLDTITDDHLEKRKIDGIIAIDTLFVSSSIKTLNISDYEFVFCASPAFLKSKNLTPKISKWELLNIPTIIHSTVLEDLQHQLDNQLSPHITSWNSDIILSLVKDGLGIGCFYKNLVKKSDVVQVEVSNLTNPLRQVVFGYHKEHSKVLRILIDELMTFAHTTLE